ncbi:hypothetical protein ACTHQ4_10390 [Alkalicoccobacillus gibsonii]|uniref:hypothetical protein n=1 Tax=Alkalicoccobacillus gibsonii TaxID=79881 RepID=UPI003F7B476C
MSFSNAMVTGGKIEWAKLTLNLFKSDEAEYETGRAVVWMEMLNNGQKPKRWNKPTKKGTGVTFTALKDHKEYEVAIGELQGHINVINKEYDLNIKLKTN